MFKVYCLKVKIEKSRYLCFLSKEKLLNGDDLKSNESMTKSSDEIPSHHGDENEGTCFFWVILKIKLFRENIRTAV